MQDPYTTTYDYSVTQAQSTNPAMAMFSGMWGAVWLLVAIVVIAGMWKIFTKAGKPGWAAIIPIYNIIVLLQVVKKPLWWIVLFFIPFVNIIISLIVMIELAKAFGKDAVFGVVLLWLLSPIGVIMLGFGKDTYKLSR